MVLQGIRLTCSARFDHRARGSHWVCRRSSSRRIPADSWHWPAATLSSLGAAGAHRHGCGGRPRRRANTVSTGSPNQRCRGVGLHDGCTSAGCPSTASAKIQDGTVALTIYHLAVSRASSCRSSARRAAARAPCCGSRAAWTRRRPASPRCIRAGRLRLPGPHLLPWRSVAANVGLFAELDHLDKAERSGGSPTPSRWSGWAVREAPAHELSGACGCARRSPGRWSSTRRLLFDEPFGALDEITRSG